MESCAQCCNSCRQQFCARGALCVHIISTCAREVYGSEKHDAAEADTRVLSGMLPPCPRPCCGHLSSQSLSVKNFQSFGKRRKNHGLGEKYFKDYTVL